MEQNASQENKNLADRMRTKFTGNAGDDDPSKKSPDSSNAVANAGDDDPSKKSPAPGDDDPSKKTPAPGDDPSKKSPESSAAPKNVIDLDNENLDDESLSKLSAILEKRGMTFQKKELTPEEKKAAEEQRKADLFNFAINGKLATSDEFISFENIKNVDAQSMFYSEFEKKVLADNEKEIELNPKAKKLKPEDAKEIFNELYHQTDDSEASLKTLGKQRLDEDAKRFKDEKLGKYNQITNLFESQEKVDVKKKAYTVSFGSFVKEVKQTIAVKVDYKSPDGMVTSVDLTIPVAGSAEEAQKLAEEFFTLPPIGDRFIMTGEYTKKENLEAAFNNFIFARNKKQVMDSIFDAGVSAGIKIGKVGTNAPIEKTRETEVVKKEEAGSGVGKKMVESQGW